MRYEIEKVHPTFWDSGSNVTPQPHYNRVVRDRSIAGYLCHLYAYCLHSPSTIWYRGVDVAWGDERGLASTAPDDESKRWHQVKK